MKKDKRTKVQLIDEIVHLESYIDILRKEVELYDKKLNEIKDSLKFILRSFKH